MWSARCLWCGADPPLLLDTVGVCKTPVRDFSSLLADSFTAEAPHCRSLNNANDPNFGGFNDTRVAEVCAAPYTARLGLVSRNTRPLVVPAAKIRLEAAGAK